MQVSQHSSHQEISFGATCSMLALVDNGKMSHKSNYQKVHVLDCSRDVEKHVAGCLTTWRLKMQRFKRGDAVWCFWQDRFGHPQMHHRPGVVTKKVHPTCYVVATMSNDPYRPKSEWHLDRTGRQRHPSDLLPYSDMKPHDDNRMDATEHLRELRKIWREETSPDIIAAFEKDREEVKRMNINLNRKLRPILGRMLSA